MKIGHIVFTTDLSPESLQPARAVSELAQEKRARITLLHVVEESLVPPHGVAPAPVIHGMDEVRLQEARAALGSVRSAFGAEIEVAIDVITSDRIAKAVTEYATEKKADLVCLSTHGRTGLRHLALGSIAESILRHSKVPLLVFPQV